MAVKKQAKNPAREENEQEQSGIDFSAHAGAGFENVTVADMAIPFLAIVQGLTPQGRKKDPEYIEGAEEGDIFNTLTNELFKADEGVELVLCNFRKVAIEWKLREKGGGLVAIHPADTDLVGQTKQDEKGRAILPSGNQLVLTAQHYVLYKNHEGDWQQALLAMSGSQLKKSRQWISRIAATRMTKPDGSKFCPPMFATIFKGTTVGEQNEKGSWAGWNIEVVGNVEDAKLFEQALSFHDTVKAMPVAAISNESAKQLTHAVGGGEETPM